MFGYVVANIKDMSAEQKKEYRSFYCGLCKTLGDNYGQFNRNLLTYDMTFLIILLSSLYQENSERSQNRCIVHPVKKQNFSINYFTEYGADMNVALAYYNFKDKWLDDKNIFAYGEYRLLEKHVDEIRKKYPRQCDTMENCLKDLAKFESENEINPDLPSACFGKIMAEIFIVKEDKYSEILYDFATELGKFIYLMDACMDLKKDIKHGQYNPLITLNSDYFEDYLSLIMASCTEKYELLPLNENKDILNNILYSGVWSEYDLKKSRRNSKNKKEE